MGNDLMDIARAKIRMSGCCDICLRGRCMEPLLRAGDRARVYFRDEYHVGDIALIGFPGVGGVLHRVVKIEGNRITTKGDFSGKSEVVGRGEILGIAQEFSLEGRKWIKDSRSPSEMLELVELSLRVRGKRSEDSLACRRKIWELNWVARQSMLDELGDAL